METEVVSSSILVGQTKRVQTLLMILASVTTSLMPVVKHAVNSTPEDKVNNEKSDFL